VGGDRPLLDSRRSRPPGGAPIDLNALVEPWIGPIVVALGVIALLLLLLVLVQALRIRRLGRRIDGLTRGEQGRSLEAILDAHLDKVFEVSRSLDEMDARAEAVAANSRRSLQRIGLVRFNPFEDTGGNQSFAVALLDGNGTGFVLSSLHARAGTRVYAKAVSSGRTEGALSAEEMEAVRQAMAGPVESRPTG
jgi:hypothetical protein